ncbi:MAG: hypothetical protein WCV67_02885 [Victivallaceae bacterium]
MAFNEPGQHVGITLGFRSAVAFGARQFRLHALPERFVDDGGMSAGKLLSGVYDAAQIGFIAQQIEYLLFRQYAAIFLHDVHGGVIIGGVHGENIADDLRTSRIDVNLIVAFGGAPVAVGRVAARPQSGGGDGYHLVAGVLGGLFALELVEHLENAQHGTSRRRGKVQVLFRDRDEAFGVAV